ncbi:hypothetical protein BDR05DRAFT_301548 [Suillus weaverae]|nr:hypothetical protein BDR05DRAFT_301548 [Suillus weaverae]
MAFGVIHCLGWNFLFPRHAELVLWRVASIAIPSSLSGFLYIFQMFSCLPERLRRELVHGQTSERRPSWLININRRISERLPSWLININRWISERLPLWLINISRLILELVGLRRPFQFILPDNPITSSIVFYYIPARLTIIVLMMLSLRSLPPGAYDTVAWTKFIPHVNL